MRVVVVGATGNVGTSLLEALAAEPAVDSVLGVARRLPSAESPKTEWRQADVVTSDLVPLLRGADAIVHLAWQIQPSRDLNRLWRVNVDGSTRVFRAAAEAGVPALVYASSVGVYSPGPKDRFVDEGWPAHGVAGSFYARHKAEVERRLDRFEQEHPRVRVVRMRPGLIFKREAAEEVRRLFAGPLFPPWLAGPGLLFVPDHPRFRFQAVHSLDVGDAYRLALIGDVAGPFNVAADPVLDGPEIARVTGARTIPIRPRMLRAAAAAAWHARLSPTPSGWVDLAFGVPLMDSARARDELGWRPRRTAAEALAELLQGLREGAGAETPALQPGRRAEEVAAGVGAREVR